LKRITWVSETVELQGPSHKDGRRKVFIVTSVDGCDHGPISSVFNSLKGDTVPVRVRHTSIIDINIRPEGKVEEIDQKDPVG